MRELACLENMAFASDADSSSHHSQTSSHLEHRRLSRGNGSEQGQVASPDISNLEKNQPQQQIQEYEEDGDEIADHSLPLPSLHSPTTEIMPGIDHTSKFEV